MVPHKILDEMWPDLKAAFYRESEAWDAYEKAGIGAITKSMVDERFASTKELERLLRKFILKGICHG